MKTFISLFAALLIVGCAGYPDTQLARQHEREIDQKKAELARVQDAQARDAYLARMQTKGR